MYFKDSVFFYNSNLMESVISSVSFDILIESCITADYFSNFPPIFSKS